MTDLDAVLARLDALESQDAIRQLKATFMQRCDDVPRPSFMDLFWADAVWQGYGAAQAGPVAGTDIGDLLSRQPQRFTFSVHYVTNESITVSGDQAVGRWKLLEPCTCDGEIGIWQGGRYVDTFERRHGEWRFVRMELHLEFRTPYEDGWHRTPIMALPPVPN
jgi:SnoaL-like domain